ncbi:MAG TPA: transcription termination factor NusA [Candidatus Sumerlaeota bacterium]|nr:transcription termination factor NusA [Candidatus Sumerlaeota bacterium]HPS00810.1 transcription termination factor NusA [Candidatus Sumerlaeota bacterium]
MDLKNLKAYVSAVAKEKDLDPAIIREAIEYALISASKKSLSQFREARASLDMETGALSLIVTKEVVETVQNPRVQISRRDARKQLQDPTIEYGGLIEVQVDPSAFGRIAAQSARQIVMQRIRDAERRRIQDEFNNRIGSVVTGTVQRFDRRDVVMNIGRTEGVLPLYEQPLGAKYKHNDRLKVLIIDVRETPKGPLIVLSRKTPNLVVKLFEQEVPEIADGTIKILGVAREAGVRTKIAVNSSSPDVDPVGACVGMKGSRVQLVVRELDNEKIDIVPYSIDAKRFITAALNPAKIQAIHLNEKEKRAEVIVAQGNLAIAIGRKGQNTKLAARLTGWRLDIRSEEEDGLEYEEIQVRYLEDFLLQVSGISGLARDALVRSQQLNTVDKIASARVEDLCPFTNDNMALAESLITGAQEYVEALREIQAERKRRGLAPGFFMPSEFLEGKGGEEEEGQAGQETGTAPEKPTEENNEPTE